MTPEAAEALTHRWHLEAVQEGKLDVADEILTPECVIHANATEVRGLAGAKHLAAALHTAFSDLRITHHEALVAGDRVAIRWTSDGTHDGDYFGVPASGRRVHLEGLDLFHMQGGKIAAIWIEFDNLAVMQQMGAIPTSG